MKVVKFEILKQNTSVHCHGSKFESFEKVTVNISFLHKVSSESEIFNKFEVKKNDRKLNIQNTLIFSPNIYHQSMAMDG